MVQRGTPEMIDSWMALVRGVRDNFPGLETEAALADHKRTVLKFMGRGEALCVIADGRVAGVLLYSSKHSMICCLAVDPAFRRRGFASALLTKAINALDRTRDITVSTFREGDPWGDAPRKLYAKFGFLPGERTVEFGYPNQVFVLPAESAAK